MSFFSSRRQPDSPSPLEDEPMPVSRPAPPQPVGFDTVLGANCTMEGLLRSRANVRLDGTFTGTLEIEGNVLVGETARITADINAKNVSIAGAVHGNVSGKKVQLLRTGRIWGDIHATALTTEEGAFIDGKITMVSHDANRTEAAESQDEIETVPLPAEIETEMEAAADTIISDEDSATPPVDDDDQPPN